MRRRAFIKALAFSSLTPASLLSQESAPGRSLVVWVRRNGLSKLSGDTRRRVYRSMLETALGVFGDDCLMKALGGRKRVGLKLNCLAGKPLSPHPDLVSSLAQLLRDGGAKQIVAWERSMRELVRAGFPSQGEHNYSVVATDERGVGYDRRIYESGDVGSLVSNALLRSDALVNLGVVKDHDLAGISCSLKNLYGVIHNPNKYHDFGCDPFVANVADLEPVRERLCLTVLDGALAQSHGGPAYKPAWAWPLDSVLVSFDPVAIDSVALRIIDEERQRRNLGSLKEEARYPQWIATASGMGLGQGTFESVDLREVQLS
jgi:uncharacterized protein (DUF362 family)